VRAVAVAQRGFERDRYGRGTNRADRRGGHGIARDRMDARAVLAASRNLTPLTINW